MKISGRTQNVPQSLFDKMLQYPETKAALSALCGLAERSQDPREKWGYKQRVIDEFTTASSAPYLPKFDSYEFRFKIDSKPHIPLGFLETWQNELKTKVGTFPQVRPESRSLMTIVSNRAKSLVKSEFVAL